MAKPVFFLDTSYTIALAAPKDQYHQAVLEISEKIEAGSTSLVTTQAIILEIGNALAKLRYRNDAIVLITALEADPSVEIIPLTADLQIRAFRLFRERTDKEWGLIDCISFIVMRERQIIDALTTDEHFEQAGFKALLRGKR